MEKKEILVLPEHKGQRIDVFLAKEINLPRSQIKKLINSQNITIINKSLKSSYQLIGNETIFIDIQEQKQSIEPISGKLEILHEDNDILVINKPADLIVHPGAGPDKITLVNYLLAYTKDLSNENGEERPGIIHRLDKDTSGVIVIAKNNKAHKFIADQFKNRTVKKIYIALVLNELRKESGEINTPIGRHPKIRTKMHTLKKDIASDQYRNAITKYKVLDYKANKSLLEVQILTGRTHQIRVHLASIGYPIFGDPIYGNKRGKKQLLHAYKLSFKHPNGKDVDFVTPKPKWSNIYNF
jgi:23S rRNA pseudouridine1911/1915/1917 synthase